jgi:P-loop Domain of unknown function (DUF2791)
VGQNWPALLGQNSIALPTPDFLLHTGRGVFSYEALRSRLAENSFAGDGLVDLSGPVIRLQSLTPEEMYVLLDRLRLLWASGDLKRLPIPDDALDAFLHHCSQKIGDDYFRTPRTTIRAFLDLLAILQQNSDADWHSLLGDVQFTPDRPREQLDIDDELSTFEISPPARGEPIGQEERSTLH